MAPGRISHGLSASSYITPPLSFTDNYYATPSGMTPAIFMWRTSSMVRDKSQQCSTSFPMYFSEAAVLRLDLADL